MKLAIRPHRRGAVADGVDSLVKPFAGHAELLCPVSDLVRLADGDAGAVLRTALAGSQPLAAFPSLTPAR